MIGILKQLKKKSKFVADFEAAVRDYQNTPIPSRAFLTPMMLINNRRARLPNFRMDPKIQYQRVTDAMYANAVKAYLDSVEDQKFHYDRSSNRTVSMRGAQYLLSLIHI